jgi:DNA replication protein DnaC
VKKGEVKNFVLCGAVGTGKTHISVAIIRHIIQQVKGHIYEFPVYFTAQYATSADINDRLVSAQSFSSKERRVDIIEQYRTCDVLVIDEVGRMPSKNEADMLFQIIDSRYQNNKSTVLCTNYNSDELKQAIGKAAVSRLGADGRLIFVNTDGIPDMRNRSVNK